VDVQWNFFKYSKSEKWNGVSKIASGGVENKSTAFIFYEKRRKCTGDLNYFRPSPRRLRQDRKMGLKTKEIVHILMCR
jgi:hypothetical protein